MSTPTRAGRRISQDGYVDLYRPGHPVARRDGYVAEHRLVAFEAGLLTDLSLHVHHRNHDKQDNRLANLEILTPEDHSKQHAAEDGWISNQFGTWPLRPPKPPRNDRRCTMCPTIIPASARTDQIHCSSACRVRYCKQRKRGQAA